MRIFPQHFIEKRGKVIRRGPFGEEGVVPPSIGIGFRREHGEGRGKSENREGFIENARDKGLTEFFTAPVRHAAK